MQDRRARQRWRQHANTPFPHHVDLVPPEDGFLEVVEEAMGNFLAPLVGKVDLYADMKDGLPFVRYLFREPDDATAFRSRFGSYAEKVISNIAS